MFEKACKIIREGLYGIIGESVIKRNGSKPELDVVSGTAFMVAPGYLITAAHIVHQGCDYKKPIHDEFKIIRAPDIGKKMEKANFIAEHIINDINFDIALLKVENNENIQSVTLTDKIIERGTNCGFLGFPLAKVQFTPDGKRILLCKLYERFQGAYISNYISSDGDQLKRRSFYEIDRLMYPGSSGCPVFTIDAKILGMQIMVLKDKTEDNKLEKVDIALAVPSEEILNNLQN